MTSSAVLSTGVRCFLNFLHLNNIWHDTKLHEQCYNFLVNPLLKKLSHVKNLTTGIFDSSLVHCTIILVLFGILAIFTTSSVRSQVNTYSYVTNQISGVVLSIGLIWIIQMIPWPRFKKLIVPGLLVCMLLLILFFVPGIYVEKSGAKRWFSLGFMTFQPAEFIKLAVIVFVAKNLSRVSVNTRSIWTGILPNLGLLGVVSILLLFQKDLGSCAIIFACTLILFWVAKARVSHIAAILGFAMLVCAVAIMIEPYRVERILSFLDPWSKSAGSGFQIIQSFLAFQNGGLTGTGLGQSTQKLFFLPEAHTDFIFAVIGEEFGLGGSLFLIVVFCAFTFYGIKIAENTEDNFLKILAVGMTCLIVVQAAANMAVVTGMLPTKGLTLPFISSGRSSLVASLICIGILLKIQRLNCTEKSGA